MMGHPSWSSRSLPPARAGREEVSRDARAAWALWQRPGRRALPPERQEPPDAELPEPLAESPPWAARPAEASPLYPSRRPTVQPALRERPEPGRREQREPPPERPAFQSARGPRRNGIPQCPRESHPPATAS